MKEKTIELVMLEEARNFVRSLPVKTADKIFYNIRRVLKGERDKELFKKLEGTDIWEFRTLYDKNIYRLFAFWDNESNVIIVATHGIVKKTKKTPPKEITKAESIRKMYFELKHK